MFVWDETKRLKVISEHKVDFALLLDAFDDDLGVYFEDVEHSTQEETRFNLIGFAARYGLIYVTVHLRKQRHSSDYSLESRKMDGERI
jgi:uncharacterized DUF497 family protein